MATGKITGTLSATLDPVTLVATAVTWGQFAGIHLWAAANFAREAHRIETEALTLPRPEDRWLMVRYNVVAAIFTAVASVEAYASEVVVEPEKRFPAADMVTLKPKLAKMLKDPSVTRKYEALATLAGGTTPDFTKDPDLAFGDLTLLRNKLVHFKAEPPWARDAHVEVEKRLRPRFTRSRILPGADFFPNGFDSYACAKWSVETAKDFVVRFATRFGWECAFITKESHESKLALP
jgi:hypothetical protein